MDGRAGNRRFISGAVQIYNRFNGWNHQGKQPSSCRSLRGKKFWRCAESGEPPRLVGIETPRPRIEAVRVVDMSASNSWAEFAGVFRRTRQAFLDHEN